MSEQLSLLEWRPPAEIVPFPFHRSHGSTAGVARAIMNLEKPKRTGRLNSIRAQTRKRMASLFGTDQAERIANDLVRMIRIQMDYQPCHPFPLHKQSTTEKVISSLEAHRQQKPQHGNGGGAADARGVGPKAPPGCGAAPHGHIEQVSARAREGGAA